MLHRSRCALAALTLLSSGCSERVIEVASDALDAAPPVDGGGGPITPPPQKVVECADGVCACNNGLDDDGDGLVDGDDSECFGPFDDDERTFATGFQSDAPGSCQDCFFDANTHDGDDGCQYDPRCELPPGQRPQPQEPDAGTAGACGGAFDIARCAPSPRCVASCQDLTPNGCDCFGCCEMRRNGDRHTVRLVETCTLDALDDDEACPKCWLNTECRNPCGMCELCPGRGIEDLPAACRDIIDPNGPGYTCDEWTVCGKNHPCRDGFYCKQGCCLPILF